MFRELLCSETNYAPYSSQKACLRWMGYDSMTPEQRAAKRLAVEQFAVGLDRAWRIALDEKAKERKGETHDTSA